MIKCLFLGHDWQKEQTYTGKRTCHLWLGKCITEHDLTLEYYQCSKCGLWKKKTYIDYQLDKTEFFRERPIPTKE